MKAAKDFNMGFQPVQTVTSFTPPEVRAAQPLTAQNNNEKPVDLAQLAGVQAVEASIFSLIDPTGTSFAMTALNLAQGFEVGAAVIDSAQTPQGAVQASQEANRAAYRTQQGGFKPNTQLNDFSNSSFGAGKKNGFTVSYTALESPSASDGQLTGMNVTDLSASMGQLANSFKPQTLGR